MKKAAVFASGSGTNLEVILNHMEDGTLDCSIDLVVCDKPDAYALTRAKNHHVEALYFNPRAYPSKKEYEEDILKQLEERDIDFLILSGYMRYIGEVLLEAYPQKIINIHPAYLPEFPGAHGIADAYNAKVPMTGVSVHYVDEGVDTGPVIAQERVPIDPSWSLKELEKAVHAKEYDLFYRVINQVTRKLEEEEK